MFFGDYQVPQILGKHWEIRFHVNLADNELMHLLSLNNN